MSLSWHHEDQRGSPLLDNSNNKIVIEYYLDLDSVDANIWFIVKVLDKYNNVIETTSKVGTTGDNSLKNNLHKYIDKYKCCIEWVFYNVVDGKATIKPPLVS